MCRRGFLCIIRNTRGGSFSAEESLKARVPRALRSGGEGIQRGQGRHSKGASGGGAEWKSEERKEARPEQTRGLNQPCFWRPSRRGGSWSANRWKLSQSWLSVTCERSTPEYPCVLRLQMCVFMCGHSHLICIITCYLFCCWILWPFRKTKYSALISSNYYPIMDAQIYRHTETN